MSGREVCREEMDWMKRGEREGKASGSAGQHAVFIL